MDKVNLEYFVIKYFIQLYVQVCAIIFMYCLLDDKPEVKQRPHHLDLSRCPLLHKSLIPPGITNCKGSDTT